MSDRTRVELSYGELLHLLEWVESVFPSLDSDDEIFPFWDRLHRKLDAALVRIDRPEILAASQVSHE